MSGVVPANAAFGVAILAICSRGLLQGMALKELAYLIQAAATGLLLLVLVACGVRARASRPALLLITYGFLVVAVLSGVYVTVVAGFPAAWIYVLVMTFFVVTMWSTSAHRFRAATFVNVPFWLGAAGIVSVAVATAQQAGFLLDVFPGSDQASMGGLVRPSGMTGSYLHYPLFISLLVFVFVQLWFTSRRTRHLLMASVLTVAVVISFSRSGVMILGLGAAAAACTVRSGPQRARLLYVGAAGALVLPLLMRDTVYSDRIMSAVRMDGAGNQTRISQWAEGFDLFFGSPIVIGGHTGMVTNVTGNLGGPDGGVVESGFLQQLVSFGVFGVVLFYTLLVLTVRSVRRDHYWLRAGMVGAVLQTFVYQSIEVVPFMTLFALMPFISQAIDDRPDLSCTSEREIRVPPLDVIRAGNGPLLRGVPSAPGRRDACSEEGS